MGNAQQGSAGGKQWPSDQNNRGGGLLDGLDDLLTGGINRQRQPQLIPIPIPVDPDYGNYGNGGQYNRPQGGAQYPGQYGNGGGYYNDPYSRAEKQPMKIFNLNFAKLRGNTEVMMANIGDNVNTNLAKLPQLTVQQQEQLQSFGTNVVVPIIATTLVARTGILSVGMGAGGSHLARSQLFRGPKPAQARFIQNLGHQIKYKTAMMRPAPIAHKQLVNTAAQRVNNVSRITSISNFARMQKVAAPMARTYPGAMAFA